jgi:hypothetical protein
LLIPKIPEDPKIISEIIILYNAGFANSNNTNVSVDVGMFISVEPNLSEGD